MNTNNINTPLSNRSDGTDPGSIIPSMYPSTPATTSNNYLSNRTFIPPTPASVNSEIDTSNITSIQQNDPRRNIIQQLALLLHAHKCLQRERQAQACNGDNNHGTAPTTTSLNLCTLPHCATMRTVLQHMTNCADFKTCSFNHCVQSRHIILHWKNCTTPNCSICGSLKKPSALRPQNSIPKEWQQQLQPDHRNHLVKKIVAALLNTVQQDGRSLPPDRLSAVTSYAQQTEAETFNTAISHEDYFHRLAERIYKIQKDYEEKQMSKKQQILTTTLTSIDKSAGEQGPPNRIAPQSDFPPSFLSSSTSSTTATQIKSENHTPNPTQSTSFDTHRISTDSLNRMTINNNNSNMISHADTNGTHADTKLIKTEQISPNHDTKIQTTTTIVKTEETITKNETSINGNNITTTTLELIKTEKTDIESTTTSNRPPPIDSTSKLLQKHPAEFAPEDIRDRMTPILRHLFDQEEGSWFRQPVTEAIAPGYFDIIKCPMDFSTIFKKLDENQYSTPFQFCEDIWLVFTNAWTYNKKTQKVYKAGLKMSEMFMELVDPAMKEFGYCCGRQYVFLAPAMFCYGVAGICCTIPREGDYFVYNNPDSSRNNLSNDKYTFCKKCFDSVKSEYILVGDDPAQTLVDLPKAEFSQAKNDHQEPEAMVDCIVCARRFHNICVLYHEHIWPEGFVCKTCVNQYNVKRKENRYLAHKLTMTDLANALEKRVNDFLRKDCDPDTGRVTIRVLAASDRISEVKPRLKKHFGAVVPDGYPYRTKAVFAFQEIDGVDVVLFGMHVQEYDGRCPAPNSRRVYISYLDSVHYFRPKQKRTALYYEILIGYLEYVKQLGFAYAHIWACPPSEGDDYIFHCHPTEQRVPKPKRLQEWYKTMLDIAVAQRVVVDFKDIMKDCSDSGITKASDLPYFEGDFWSSTIEDLLKELDTEEEDRRKLEELEAVKASDDGYIDDPIEPEEPTEISDKRKSGGGTTHKKKNFKKTAGQRRIARKNMSNGADLITKIYAMMEKHKESFFVVRLRNPMSNPPTLTDTDPLIQCDLMESRDAFLTFAREKHCEFSSLRRAKYSTLASLIELHSSTADKISYTCNSCRQLCDVRYHCTVCDDYDLCSKCYTTIKHEHRMDRSDDANETPTSSDTPLSTQQQRQVTMQKMLDAIRHAVQCRNANCIFKNCAPCQRLLQHTKECTKASRNQCPLCQKLISPIWYHAKTCTDQNCPLPYCASFKHKLQRQRAATMQADRRRIKAMHRAKMAPVHHLYLLSITQVTFDFDLGPSPLGSQNTESTPVQYHHPMESASPSSSGKMMPSGGKGGKPASMSGLVRTNLPSQQSSSQHPAYYNGGKGNPAGGGYPMMMTHPQQSSQQWLSQQQQHRYATHLASGGKPMAYAQQRMPYGVDPYMMRQQTPQVPSSSYPYTSNIAPPGYSHSQPMDPNALAAARAGKPMMPQQQQQQQQPQVPNRYPLNSYYSHPSQMPYQQQSQVPQPPHRSLSQGPTPTYSMPSSSVPSNGTGGKPISIDSIESKPDDLIDDPSKQQQQQQQQQQMFHPLLQSRSRSQTPSFYPNMPQTNSPYYPSQRPMAPTSDYNMAMTRGIRPPNPAYNNLAVQQRVRTPLTSQLSSSTNDPTAGMNTNPMGLQSTPPPPSVTPR
ncbi:unnamed protein product [Adineta steineri]|uniref:histone acetyltransferase n=1 Tax=Adineta steineri TaxID=433720 RepID=A0A815EMQ3_9BILA|nr:unnamed protein product [Adineta steineri]CAF3634446.1 unnamed protein product [Adineta steineri]